MLLKRAAAVAVSGLLLLGLHGVPPQMEASDEQAGHHVEASKVDAQELAEILGIQVWAFHYSGGRIHCSVEIDEDGKNKEVLSLDSGKNSQKGRILFWVQRGQIVLRASPGGTAGMGLPNDGLWWGWKSWTGEISTPDHPVAPKPGEEFTLMTH